MEINVIIQISSSEPQIIRGLVHKVDVLKTDVMDI